MLDDPILYGLEIKNTKTMGKGVFALIPFKKGEYIAPYKYEKKNEYTIANFKKKYGNDTLYTYRNQRKNLVISVKDNRNVITYINENKKSPNVVLKSLKLYALRDIKRGEQLFLKYYYKTEFK